MTLDWTVIGMRRSEIERGGMKWKSDGMKWNGMELSKHSNRREGIISWKLETSAKDTLWTEEVVKSFCWGPFWAFPTRWGTWTTWTTDRVSEWSEEIFTCRDQSRPFWHKVWPFCRLAWPLPLREPILLQNGLSQGSQGRVLEERSIISMAIGSPNSPSIPLQDSLLLGIFQWASAGHWMFHKMKMQGMLGRNYVKALPAKMSGPLLFWVPRMYRSLKRNKSSENGRYWLQGMFPLQHGGWDYCTDCKEHCRSLLKIKTAVIFPAWWENHSSRLGAQLCTAVAADAPRQTWLWPRKIYLCIIYKYVCVYIYICIHNYTYNVYI